ncbi:MAG: sporulation protein [Thermotogales bacterium]|nr:sporulation protein [Thermotogales bacterium]
MDGMLKQRLVGAIVLVALAVIFVPMVLEGPNRTLVPEMEALPEPEDQAISAPLESFPAPDAIPAEPDTAIIMADPQPADMSEAPAEPAESEPEPAQPVTEPEHEPVVAEPEPEDRPTKPEPLGSWVVQMGSFSSEQNALRRRDELRKNGFVAQVEKAAIDGKPVFRVRVGPFLERADAELSRKQIQDKLTLKGRVFSYP